MITQCLILFISNIKSGYNALVPIGHSPKTEGPNMNLMFWPSRLLGQQISYIVLSRNLTYLHISSLDDLSNEMKSPEYVFGSLV